ncbi:hypothetical protein Tco_0492340 [Tanacetum coccineum]
MNPKEVLKGKRGVAAGSRHTTTDASMIEDLSTRLGNLEYGHGQLVKKVIHVSDAEVAAGVSIEEISPRVFAIEGQAAIQQRDSQIQRLQTAVSEMGSRESTLMQCILGMDRRLA